MTEKHTLVLFHFPHAKQIATKYAKQLHIESKFFPEIESETAIVLLECAEKYDPATMNQFMSYAHLRIRGAVVDWLRRETNARRATKRGKVTWEMFETERSEKVILTTVDKGVSVEHRMIEAESMCQLMSAIESLPEAEQEVIKLHYFQGWKLKKIARERLSVNPSLVSLHHKRGLKRLADKLRDEN